ncbi:TIP41-domain-containing protein [Ceraceosorus guamensis]|uniref:TIP41-domain-containing protein n=1 Tax=Ceraceosorus guamensis TaxID=1522189 RepID=A0A316VZF5_9BASI|nr:TIP41-domain-containing protein [Ceraceosorus guamensis]PWN42829.1 TIP41-domain-containing protein [Ceraceosorus guamensis]
MRSISGSSSAPHELFDYTSSASGSVPHEQSSDASAPSPSSIADTLRHKGIKIAGFTIRVTHGSIASSAAIDELSSDLQIPMPEMPFLKNRVSIEHEATGWKYDLDSVEALKCVEGVAEAHKLEGISFGVAGSTTARARVGEKKKRRNKVKVAYAKEWGRSREQVSSSTANVTHGSQAQASTAFRPDIAPALKASAAAAASSIDDASRPTHIPGSSGDAPIEASGTAIGAARDYDWTYTSTYAGTEQIALPPGFPNGASAEAPSTASPAWTPAAQLASKFRPASDSATDRIPTERLGPGTEPILFFDEVVLFEDELGDNGTSAVSVKVRVMPSCLLLLCRFFLRVDDVLFRIFDTRLFVDFQANAQIAAQASQAGSTATTQPDANLGSLSLGTPRGRNVETPAHSSAAVGPPRVVRECSGCEASYAEVKAKLPAWKPNDLSPLTDPNWVASTLATLSSVRARQALCSSRVPGAESDYTNGQLPRGAPVELGPASIPSRLPHMQGATNAQTLPRSNAILGEVDDEAWLGQGARCDVALLE